MNNSLFTKLMIGVRYITKTYNYINIVIRMEDVKLHNRIYTLNNNLTSHIYQSMKRNDIYRRNVLVEIQIYLNN